MVIRILDVDSGYYSRERMYLLRLGARVGVREKETKVVDGRRVGVYERKGLPALGRLTMAEASDRLRQAQATAKNAKLTARRSMVAASPLTKIKGHGPNR